MDLKAVLSAVTQRLKEEPGIEGVFLYNPVSEPDCEDVTMLEIGVVTKDTLKDLRKAFTASTDVLHAAGTPIHIMEREWEHCKEARALYGRTAFPPLGFSLRLVFCQMKYVAEQAPRAGHQLLFDHSGTLQEQLSQAKPAKPGEQVAIALKQQLSAYPFHLHDAVRALAQKDRAAAQSATEQMRQAIYYAAAVRAGHHAHGIRRGWHSLAPGEKWVLEHSYQNVTLRNIERLTQLYIACLTALQTTYPLEQEVNQLKQALPELLS